MKIVSSQHGNIIATDAMKCEILVEGENELENLPEDIAVGSIAYTADFSGLWMKGLNGEWKKV